MLGERLVVSPRFLIPDLVFGRGMFLGMNCVISPLLANIFLHYVLDEWFFRDVVPRMKRQVSLVRYCDDFAMVFEDFLDSDRVLGVLGKRMLKYDYTQRKHAVSTFDFDVQTAVVIRKRRGRRSTSWGHPCLEEIPAQ